MRRATARSRSLVTAIIPAVLLLANGYGPAFQADADDAKAGLPRPILHLDGEGDRFRVRLFTVVLSTDGQRVKTLSENKDTPAWSPDGERFAALSGRPDGLLLNLMNLRGEVVDLMKFRPGEVLSPPAWAPDGKRVALVVGGQPPAVLVIDVERRAAVARHSIPKGVVFGPRSGYWSLGKFRWSPDGTKILVSLEAAAVIDTVRDSTESISVEHVLAEWAPGGDAVYYFAVTGEGLGDFFVRKLGSDRPVRLLDAQSLQSQGWGRSRGLVPAVMTLSPSGSKLIIAAGTTGERSHVVRVYDVARSEALDLAKPAKNFVTDDLITAVDWAPDERSVAAITIEFRPMPSVRVKILDIATGGWKTIGTIAIPLQPPAMDALGLKTLSWTQ